MLAEKSYAKINLFLHVINKRDDGYHNIATLMTKIDLYDTIVIEGSKNFEIISNVASVPLNRDNIIWKVYELLKSHYNISPVRVYLYKNIPMGAGLGGGSSNAATFLNLVDQFYSLRMSFDEKYGILSRVGSDTVFFLKDAQTVIARGRGELLEIGPSIPHLNLLLVKPSFSVSTKEAYGGAKLRLTNNALMDKMTKFLTYPLLLDMLENDFEASVFRTYSELRFIKDLLIKYGADAALMSGSGSTMYGLFSSKNSLNRAYNFFNRFSDYFVLKSNTI